MHNCVYDFGNAGSREESNINFAFKFYCYLEKDMPLSLNTHKKRTRIHAYNVAFLVFYFAV